MKRITIIALAMILLYISALVLPAAIHPMAEPVSLPEGAAGERIACIDDNVEALVWRIRMIETAQEEIILSTFGFGTGRAGQDIMAALLQAANRGVRVQLLLDGYNSAKTLQDNNFRTLAAHCNVEVRVYNPLNLLQPWSLNFRMHDKYLIADRQMYLIGGRNTNNLFLGNYSDTPNIDRDILVYGSGIEGSAGQLMAYFSEVWALSEAQEINEAGNPEFLTDRYGYLKKAYPEAFGFSDWQAHTVEAASVALICGQTQASTKSPQVWKQLCGYMAQGQQVLIQTPYVICNDEMYRDLTAITAGGTAVQILTNSPQTGANPFGCTDLINNRRNILNTGVTLMEYTAEHSLHAKTVLIDDSICIIGSFNLDMRSAYIDTETMLVVDCPELNAQLRQQVALMGQSCVYSTPDGAQMQGAAYQKQELGFYKSLKYTLLGLASGFFRHLM